MIKQLNSHPHMFQTLFSHRRFSTKATYAFPTTLAELQEKVKTCLTIETGLADSNSSCNTDKSYIERRNSVTRISAGYDLVNDRHLPHIEY
jgi:hypothetical protein